MNITRQDLLRRLVLNEASDGYRHFAAIERESGLVAMRCGLLAGSEEIGAAVAALIGQGYLRAVELSSREAPRAIEGVPTEADLHRVYFFQTESGVRENASGYWPFDDDGRVLPDLCIIDS